MAGKVGFEPTTNRLTADRSTAELLAKKMEPEVGFEPTTDGLQNRCSTTELFRQKGLAGEGIEPSWKCLWDIPIPRIVTRNMKLLMPIQ